MTLCLTATCKWEGESAIVCCCDFTGVRDDVMSESAFKIRWIEKNVVMLAGDLSAATELLTACEKSVARYESGGNDMAVDGLLQSLRAAVKSHRREINDVYLSSRYGYSFDEFLRDGKGFLPEIEHLQIWAELKALDLRGGLIVSSFSDDEAVHITVSSNGDVAWADHFAALGTGARLCNAFLQQRTYSDHMPIEECIYRVLEAKLAAERNPYVGKQTFVMLYTPTRLRWLVSDYVKKLVNLIETRRAIPHLSEIGFDDSSSYPIGPKAPDG